MNNFNYANQVCKYFDLLYNKRVYADFQRYDRLISQFKKYFKYDNCRLASASGRVEVIGNHTDHNGGKVIGCGINLDIIAAFMPNGSNSVRLVSEGYNAVEYRLDKEPQLNGGVGLAEGVTSYIKQAGYNVGGFNLFTHSAIPSGAGISSSAAFEMLIAAIVNVCFNDGTIPEDLLAKSGQYAENKYLNKPCGLLDQGASIAGGMVKFNFQNGFDYEKIDNRADVRFLLVNTGKSHAGLSDLYADIPKEMFSVADYFGKKSLIEVSPQQLFDNEQSVRSKVGNRPYLRAKHFFEENARVELVSSALRQGDSDGVIKLINESGDSSLNQLQNCAVDIRDTAIPYAIDFARGLGNVGARVHGGGFAGTILCVVKTCDFQRVSAALNVKYGEQNVLPMFIRNVGTTVL